MPNWSAGPVARAWHAARFVFSFGVVMGLLTGAALVGVVVLWATPVERYRPGVHAACDAAFAEFLVAEDQVAFERARVSLDALGCDLGRRLTPLTGH